MRTGINTREGRDVAKPATRASLRKIRMENRSSHPTSGRALALPASPGTIPSRQLPDNRSPRPRCLGPDYNDAKRAWSSGPNPDVVELHITSASFVRSQWLRASRSPRWSERAEASAMARRGQKLATPRAVDSPRSIHQHGAGASPSVLGQVNCGQVRRRRPPCGPRGPADSESRTRPQNHGAFLPAPGLPLTFPRPVGRNADVTIVSFSPRPTHLGHWCWRGPSWLRGLIVPPG